MSFPSEFVFAASAVGEPWWWLGEVTRQILATENCTVNVVSESGSQQNPRWVGRGDALIGATMTHAVVSAQKGINHYAGEEFPEFRAIARVDRPAWFAMAATMESGIRSLADVAERQLPVRILGPKWTAVSSHQVQSVLRYYGLSPEKITEFGGRFHFVRTPFGAHSREGDVDVIMNLLYMGNTPNARYWNEASILQNLRFLELPQDLREQLVAEGHGEHGVVPRNFLRGLEADYPTVRAHDLVIYGRHDLDDAMTYDLARLYDENGEKFLNAAVHMGLHPSTVGRTAIPLHPGAERYYRERGYLAA